MQQLHAINECDEYEASLLMMLQAEQPRGISNSELESAAFNELIYKLIVIMLYKVHSFHVRIKQFIAAIISIALSTCFIATEHLL